MKDTRKRNRKIKINKRKLIRNFLILLALLFILFLSLFFIFKRDKILRADMTNTREFNAHKDDLGYIRGKDLYFYKKGKLKFKKEVKAGSKLEIGKGNILLSEGNTLYILSKEDGSVEKDLKFKEKIQDLEVSDGKNYIYGKNFLSILDDKYNISSQYDLDGTGFSYTKGIYTNILSMEDDLTFNFNIYFKKMGRLRKILSLSTREALLYNRYINNEKHVLASNNGLYLYNMDELVKRISLGELNGIGVYDGKISLIDGMVLRIFDGDLNILGERNLDFPPKKLIYMGNRVFVLGDGDLYVYDDELKEEVEKFICKDIYEEDGDVYLIYDDKIVRY